MMWLKWLISSIMYPVIKRRVTKMFKGKTREQRIDILAGWLVADHWSKKYWFGRAIEVHACKVCNL